MHKRGPRLCDRDGWLGDAREASKPACCYTYPLFRHHFLPVSFQWLCMIKRRRKRVKAKIPFTLCDPVGAFVRSVGDATNDVIKICAWVVIFKTVCDGLSTLPIPSGTALFFEFILEVTNGCRAAAGKAPIPALAAIISFGGLSVHCQIMSYLRYTKLKMRYFYTARAVCASFSAIICMELLKVFPCEVSVFATDSSVTPAAYSVSVPALAALLIMSVLLILEVDSDKKMC